MRNCPSCGAEIVPGNRFCVECGAPADPDTPGSSSVPGTATPPPRQGMNRTIIIVIAVAAICVIIAAVVFSGMAFSKAGSSAPASSSSSSSPRVSVAPTGYAVVLTSPPVTTVPAPTFTPNIQHSDRFGSDYLQVYTIGRNFTHGQKESFSQDLTSPPLYIRFSLNPVMINRHVVANIGTSIEHMINTTEVSPNAWFEVKVFDAKSGNLVDHQGFGKDYTYMPDQEFMVREPGNYRVEMSGHEVFANISILTGVP